VRTTFTMSDDVAAEVERLRREEGVGVSEALNRLVRAGLRVEQRASTFRQASAPLGLRVDVSNVAEALALLDEESQR